MIFVRLAPQFHPLFQHIVHKQSFARVKWPSSFSRIYHAPIYHTLCTSPNLPSSSCRSWHMDQLQSWVLHLSNHSPLLWFSWGSPSARFFQTPFSILKNFSFKFSILSFFCIQNFIHQSFSCIFREYILLHFLSIHSLQLQKAVATTQILDVRQLLPKVFQITQIPLELSFLPRDGGSSTLLQLLLKNLFFSSPTPSPFLEFYQVPSQYPQNTSTTFSSYSYIPLAFFALQTMCLLFLFQT